MLASINIEFPSTTGNTAEQRYGVWPYKGRWRMIAASFAPATTQAAGDETNAAHLTLATNDGAGGSFTVHDTLTGNGVAYTVGTTRSWDVDVAGVVELTEGMIVRVAKTVDGTGGTIDGSATIVAEKIN